MACVCRSFIDHVFGNRILENAVGSNVGFELVTIILFFVFANFSNIPVTMCFPQ